MTKSIHLWGFHHDTGEQKLPDLASASELTVFEHYERVVGNIHRHGGEIINQSSTRSLDGLLVGVEFLAPAHVSPRHGGHVDAIWHRILTPSQVWPA